VVPAGYFSYQINPNLWLGMSSTAPFGLSVSFPNVWAGRNYAEDTTLRTYNVTPTIAYRINDWISVGAGGQLQYPTANLWSGLGASPATQLNIGGRGWGFGFTAGATLNPMPGTTLGIGWRSAINQDIDGALTVTGGVPATAGSVSTTLKLPDTVTGSIRQVVTPQLTLAGTVEWANWSRIGTSVVNQPSGAPALLFGAIPVTLALEYKDGWVLS